MARRLARVTSIAALAALAAAFAAPSGAQSPPPLPYLGQKPPGDTPAPFAPSFFAMPDYVPHGTVAFSPNGEEMFWGVISRTTPRRFTMFTSRLEDGRWTTPREPAFLGGFSGLCPVFAPGGRRLYFHSNRPQSHVPKTNVGTTIWYVDRAGTGWSEPTFATINTGYELSLALTASGAAYIASFRETKSLVNGFDIWKADHLSDTNQPAPVRLGPSVNTARQEFFPAVSPDESYLLFDSDRASASTDWRLFLSMRNKEGSWSDAIDTTAALGSAGGDAYPSFSADGKYVFFVRTVAGQDPAYYWVEAWALARLRPPQPGALPR